MHVLEGRQIWNPLYKPKYIQKLNRIQTSTVFKARTRMLDLKNNFRGKYQDIWCRGCGLTEETQDHVLEECPGIHTNEKYKVKKEEIFNDEADQNAKAAEKIIHIMKKIQCAVPIRVQPGHPGMHLTN